MSTNETLVIINQILDYGSNMTTERGMGGALLPMSCLREMLEDIKGNSSCMNGFLYEKDE